MKKTTFTALAIALITAILSGCKTVGAIKEDFNNAFDNTPGESSQQIVVPTDKKEMVREVQIMLKSKGFNPGPIDGLAGASTQSALNDFQSTRRLPSTGGVNREAYIQLASDNDPQSGNKNSNQDTRECVRNFKKQSGLKNYQTTANLDGVSKEQAAQRLVRVLGRKGFVINENDRSRGYVNATFGAGSSDIQLSAFIDSISNGAKAELNYANTGTSFGVILVPGSAYRNELCEYINAMRTGH